MDILRTQVDASLAEYCKAEDGEPAPLLTLNNTARLLRCRPKDIYDGFKDSKAIPKDMKYEDLLLHPAFITEGLASWMNHNCDFPRT